MTRTVGGVRVLAGGPSAFSLRVRNEEIYGTSTRKHPQVV